MDEDVTNEGSVSASGTQQGEIPDLVKDDGKAGSIEQQFQQLGFQQPFQQQIPPTPQQQIPPTLQQQIAPAAQLKASRQQVKGATTKKR